MHHTDVHDTKYGSHFFQNTDMICNVVRMSLLQYTDVHKLRISTIYGRRQYTDVYNIRTLTIYGRSASPYIVNVRILSSPKSKSVYCKRPYIEKIAVSQDIVNCASPYIVTPKTIYGLANVRILFFDHCDAGVTVSAAENRLHGSGCVYEVIVVVRGYIIWLGIVGGGRRGCWGCCCRWCCCRLRC